MVFTHLPSNVLLAADRRSRRPCRSPIALLLARTALSQMDVPTRQAYVMALVEPDERTPAAAYTNTARYLDPPARCRRSPARRSRSRSALPFVIAGTIKSVYDLVALALVLARPAPRRANRRRRWPS